MSLRSNLKLRKVSNIYLCDVDDDLMDDLLLMRPIGMQQVYLDQGLSITDSDSQSRLDLNWD